MRLRFSSAAVAAVILSACGSPTTSTPVDQFPNGPKITCPDAPPAIASPAGQPMVVQYGTPITTGGAPTVSVSCAPPSGALFPVGTTAVTCTATDARQRTDTCTFQVAVRAPNRIAVTRFVAFGDSITWGEDGRSALTVDRSSGAVQPAFQVPVSQTYPSVLQLALQARYTTQSPTVTNAGLPSEKAGDSDTLSRFNAQVASSSYDVVLLMEGSNDLANRDSRDIPPAVANLRTMIRNAKSRNLRPFLATVPPMVAGRPRALAWSLVPELNAQIRSAASAEGVPLVDIEAGLGSSFDQYIGFDGLHPNESGYAKIAEVFFTAIRTSLEQPATPTTAVSAPFVRRPHK